ncbi:MAG: PEP-CTERM sorting domain-containing protein [Phycisphaerae bacterium]|nr:PEP-CTERM sorting domain-containing protein [Phycisphaerae bacterium]
MKKCVFGGVRYARAGCLGVLLLSLAAGSAAGGTVEVALESEAGGVSLSDTFSLTIMADISDPLLGFGFELTFDEELFKLDSTTIGGDFTAATNVNEGFFSALAFPMPVSGEEVILGSATFTALQAGKGSFGISVTEGDPTQGFAEVSVGSLADYKVSTREFTIASPINAGGGGVLVPEPTILSLLAFGCLIVARRRR